MKIKSLSFSILTSLALVTACQPVMINTGLNPQSKATITGVVEFPPFLPTGNYSSFTMKATIPEVGDSATVSLIYPPDYSDINKRHKTIATGLTSSTGVFSINPSANFNPIVGDNFILEGTRRIGGQGNDIISVRTNIRWNGNGWDSITYPGIMINAKTTALSVISGYNSDNLKSNDIIHKFQIISGQVQLTDITSSTGFIVSSSVVSYVENLVTKAVAHNLDPVFEISCDSLVCKLQNDIIPGEYIIKKGQYTSSYDWSLFLADPNLQISPIGDSASRLYLVKLRNSLANIFKYDKLFEFREGNVLLSTSPVTDSTQPPNDILNPENYTDTFFTKQYALEKIGAIKGWNITSGSGQVVVAVIDTGVDYTHEDFGCSGVTPSTSDSSLSSDCRLTGPSKWKNYSDKGNITNNPMDTSGHGTHVAGIIAAVANNGKGIAGLANNPNIKIMPVKVGNNPLSIASSAIADGIMWAANNGADIINLSIGGPPSKVIEDAVNYAITQKGKYVVAAAGNNCSRDGYGNDRLNYCSALDYPASYRGVISVGASDRNDNLWNTTSNGSQYPPNIITLTAPGDKIYSTLPGNQYGYKSGTSMATPFVSALAAMVKYQNPLYNKDQINQAIINGVIDPGAEGRDDKFGWGRINVYKTLLAGKAIPPEPVLNNISATVFNENWSIPLKWDSVPNATKYKIYRNESYYASVNATSFTDVSLTDSSYSYYVQSCNEISGCSGNTSPTTVNKIPSIPLLNDVKATGLISEGWNSHLSWNLIPDAKSYKIFRDGIEIKKDIIKNYYKDKFLNGNSYIYTVQACNEIGCSQNSVTKTANSCSGTNISDCVDVSTFSGTGIMGFKNENISFAEFSFPSTGIFDSFGNLFVAEYGNNKIRKITSDGTVSTFAGSGSIGSQYDNGNKTGTNATFFNPGGITIDNNNNLFVVERNYHLIKKITSDATVSVFAGNGEPGFINANGLSAKFTQPYGNTIDSNGNLYVTDFLNQVIRKITPDGTVSTFVGGSFGFQDGQGTNAKFNGPFGIAYAPDGNIFVTELSNHKIRKITPDGTVSTFAGWIQGDFDGTGTNASFKSPQGIVVEKLGGVNYNLYISDTGNNKIKRITSSGVVTTIAGSTYGYANGTGSTSQFKSPEGLVSDSDGNLLIMDNQNHRIRKILK